MKLIQEHKEILLSKSDSKTLPEWYEYFKQTYTKNQIYSFCNRNNKSIKKISEEDFSIIQGKKNKKYDKNEDYFKTWSPNMAYILGFWWADGCIYTNRNRYLIDITVQKKDKYILNRIKEEMCIQNPLGEYKDKKAFRLNFSSRIIYNDIVNIGGTERKSMDCIFPNIPKEYLGDFIRGYFDGDGSIWNIKGGRINTSFVSGSKVFITSLLRVLKSEAHLKGGSISKKENVYVLSFGKRDSILLGKFLYNDNTSLYLKRKKDKFIL